MRVWLPSRCDAALEWCIAAAGRANRIGCAAFGTGLEIADLERASAQATNEVGPLAAHDADVLRTPLAVRTSDSLLLDDPGYALGRCVDSLQPLFVSRSFHGVLRCTLVAKALEGLDGQGVPLVKGIPHPMPNAGSGGTQAGLERKLLEHSTQLGHLSGPIGLFDHLAVPDDQLVHSSKLPCRAEPHVDVQLVNEVGTQQHSARERNDMADVLIDQWIGTLVAW